jgi:SdrD B-like domain
MPTNVSASGRNTRQAVLRRRSLASVVVGAFLVLGTGLLPLLPGFGSGATASTLINGRAFIDLNADGTQNTNADPLYNEVGIPNLTVTVTSRAGTSVVTTTNDLGDWVINTDLPGPFRVQYTGLPPKLSDGSNRAGSLQFNNGGLTNFGAFGKVDNLGSIVDITDVDMVGIGNRVWDDLNANGVQDAGEPGIPNVIITISSTGGPLRTAAGCNGTTGDGVATTLTTDAEGLYQFVCLDAGKNFTLSIDKSQLAAGGSLAGYNATISGAGGDITLDSNGLDGGTAIIGSGVTILGFDMSYDFGFVKSGGGSTTTTTASATTTTTAWDTTTTAPTTTICDWTTTTVPATTTTVPVTTTTTVVWDTTTTTIGWDATTTTVPVTTTTTTALPATTTVPATTTTIGWHATTTTVPVTTTTVPAATTTTATVPATTTVPVTITTTTTTKVSAPTSVLATTSTTTTTVLTYIFVPVTSTMPAPTTTTSTIPVSATTSMAAGTTTTMPVTVPINVLGNEITRLPVPGDVPAFTGSATTYRGFQGVGLLLIGLGLAGLVRGRKERFEI